MSARRIYINGIPQWEPVDDGASPSRASKGIRGGIGNPIVFGVFVVGESEASRNRRQSAEHKARAK